MPLLLETEPWILAWCFVALLSGGLVKGALGVGTPLLPVPLMSWVLPPQLAVAMMAMPVVVANLVQVSEAGRPVETIRRFWPAFVFLLFGTWIGVKVLSIIDDRWLLGLVGMLVVGFGVWQGSRQRFHIPRRVEKVAGAGFGLAAGVIGGISSFFGPMLIIFLVSIPGLSKERFVGSISFLYVAAVIPWTISLFVYGVLDASNVIWSVLAIMPVTLGLYLGKCLRDHVSEQRFHRMVIVVLVGSGLTMLWRALH